MKRSAHIILACLLLMLFFVTQGYARGIAVSPERVEAENIPLGRRINLEEICSNQGYLLIENKNPQATWFSVNILKTEQTTAALIAGYQDIPDTNWVQPETPSVLIPANSNKRMDLYINIPNKRRYAGKAYQAIIEVKSQKNKPTDLFVYAAQICLLISTERKP